MSRGSEDDEGMSPALRSFVSLREANITRVQRRLTLSDLRLIFTDLPLDTVDPMYTGTCRRIMSMLDGLLLAEGLTPAQCRLWMPILLQVDGTLVRFTRFTAEEVTVIRRPGLPVGALPDGLADRFRAYRAATAGDDLLATLAVRARLSPAEAAAAREAGSLTVGALRALIALRGPA